MENTIAKANESRAISNPGKKSIQDLIKQMQPEIKKALPSVLTPERFTRMTLSALSTTPQLGECTPISFLGAMMTAAQLGVEPNTPLGQAYLLPYRNKGVMEVQFQLGYKGLLDLAYRSGEVSNVQVHAVYEQDTFEYALGLEPVLNHVPAQGDRGDAIAYYAVVRMKDGGYIFDVMTRRDIEKHAKKFSKAYESSFSPWKTNFDEMAKKTVLKKVLKYAPLKSDFVKATVQDGVIKNEISDEMYQTIDTTDYVEVDPNTGEVIEHAE